MHDKPFSECEKSRPSLPRYQLTCPIYPQRQYFQCNSDGDAFGNLPGLLQARSWVHIKKTSWRETLEGFTQESLMELRFGWRPGD